MEAIIDPPWVSLKCADLDAWDSTLSAEGFRAAVMFSLTQMRRGLCPPGSGHLAYFAGPATGGMRGALIELDRIVPFNSEGARGFEFIAERREAYMRKSSGNKKVAAKREAFRRSLAEQPPGPPPDAYELPAYAGGEKGREGVNTTGGTTGVTSGAPLVAQKEKEEKTRAPGPPSASLHSATPVGPTPLVASSEGSGEDGPPSSATRFADGEKYKGDWVCVLCGACRNGETIIGAGTAPLCIACDLACVPAPLAAVWGRDDIALWLEKNEPYRRGKPLPAFVTDGAVALKVPAAAKAAAVPVDRGEYLSTEATYENREPGRREVHLSGVSGPVGSDSKRGAGADSNVLEMQAHTAQPARIGAQTLGQKPARDAAQSSQTAGTKSGAGSAAAKRSGPVKPSSSRPPHSGQPSTPVKAAKRRPAGRAK